MINKLHQHIQGFTLVETLIAISVLMIAITGPLTLAGRGLHATVVAKDQDSAFYLAQDAIEYIRWVRDTNKLRSAGWLVGLENCTSAAGTTACYINSLAHVVSSCGAATCPTAINYDSTNNYYTYSTGSGIQPSIFTRTVRITDVPCGGSACTDEKAVTVIVSWRDQGSIVRSVTVRENIFSWQ